MVLVLDKDDGWLRVFASAAEAYAQCKGVDVRDGYWLFFADDGSPLEARFEHPDVARGSAPVAHAFALQRAMSGRWLQERLDQVRTVSGGGLSSADDLAEMLKINRSKRIAPQKRG